MRLWWLLLVPMLSGCVGFWTGAEDAAAPAFQVEDIDGRLHNLTGEGIVLLDFMGTWCGPCQRGVPDLRALQDDYNITLLSISSTDTSTQMADFRSQYRVTWPMIVDRDGVIQAYREAAGHSQVIWPSYALVKDDRLVFFNGGETLPSTLAAAIEAAGAPAPPLDRGVWLPVAFALFLGGATATSPFLWHRTRRQEMPWQAVLGVAGLFVAVTVMATYGGRPLTGRVVNVSGLAALAGVAVLGLARLRGLAAVQVGSKALDDERTWRRAVSWVANWAYVGLPLWAGILLVAMRQTVAGAVPLVLLSYTAALVATSEVLRRRKAPFGLVWLGAAGLIAAALSAFVQWIR